MSDPLSRHTLRVRGYHLDGYGHVNNARYLEFMEEGRWGFFDDHPALIKQLKQSGYALVVVNLNIDYCKAALERDDLLVLTGIIHVGERSAVCHHQVIRQRDSALVARADLTFVLLDIHANKAVPIEGQVREALDALTLAKSDFLP